MKQRLLGLREVLSFSGRRYGDQKQFEGLNSGVNTMPSRMRRRDVLKLSVAAAAGPLAAELPAAEPAAKPKLVPEADKLTAYQDGPQVWVRWNNNLLTSYRAHRSQKYPYMYPVAGPASGLSLTTETSLPWPHHRSLLFACDRVNAGNYWQGAFAVGQIFSTGPKPGKATPESAEILDACDWQKPGGPVVMNDQRKITVTVAGPRVRFIDWEIQWSAVEDVTIQKTNHSLFSIRAAMDLTPWGSGNLVNAEGLSGEKATFGKPSAWCAFYGKRASIPGEVVEGIAILDHPKNPWSPCPWFTRDYGFISPTPLNFIEKPWEMAAGKAVSLRYRVVLFAGDVKEADLAGIYKAWAAA